MSSDVEVAWAAGLFEGEGSFGAYKVRGKYWNVTASLEMTDRDTVERFVAIVGVGSVTPAYRYPSVPPNRKPTYRWRVNGSADVPRVINLLLPWLCERRRAKALDVLAKALTLRPGFTTFVVQSHCKNGHPMVDGNLSYERWRGKTTRRCKTCRQARQRADYAKKRAEAKCSVQ